MAPGGGFAAGGRRGRGVYGCSGVTAGDTAGVGVVARWGRQLLHLRCRICRSLRASSLPSSKGCCWVDPRVQGIPFPFTRSILSLLTKKHSIVVLQKLRLHRPLSSSCTFAPVPAAHYHCCSHTITDLQSKFHSNQQNIVTISAGFLVTHPYNSLHKQ